MGAGLSATSIPNHTDISSVSGVFFKKPTKCRQPQINRAQFCALLVPVPEAMQKKFVKKLLKMGRRKATFVRTAQFKVLMVECF